ncbi:MAG: hypothetical protein ABJJ92_04665 [Tateyamaria sp.]
MMTISAAQASSPARQIIRVACPVSTPDVPRAQMQSLCLHMVQSLSQLAPGAALRRVPMTAPAPKKVGDMLVRLDIRNGTIALWWQTGPQSVLYNGPAQDFDLTLLQAGPAAHRAAMDDLVAGTGAMIAALPK